MIAIDDIAKLDGVHRATAARLVARAREQLAGQTRRLLIQRLALGARQLDRVLWIITTQLDVSVRRPLVRD